VRVEVVFALPDRTWRVAVDVADDATVADAIRLSGVTHEFSALGAIDEHVGIHGKTCLPTTRLRDGDRVELYRPLLIDPKDARRRRAGDARRPKPPA